MADATALLDEMLTVEQDVFLEAGNANDQTCRSMKALVAEIIGTLPKAGAEAYQLQFRTRADRALQEARGLHQESGEYAFRSGRACQVVRGRNAADRPRGWS